MLGTTWIKQRRLLLTLGIVLGQAGWIHAETQGTGRNLVLRVENRADVSAKVLALAQVHFERIYAEAGVQMSWIESDEGFRPTADQNTLEVVVVLAPEGTAALMEPQEHIMGIALGANGAGCRRAYVFPERVAPHAERARREILFPSPAGAVALVLGQVIAHEVGHLLLPPGSHARSGIMQAQLVAEQGFQQHLSFLAEEEQLIQRALGAATASE